MGIPELETEAQDIIQFEKSHPQKEGEGDIDEEKEEEESNEEHGEMQNEK